MIEYVGLTAEAVTHLSTAAASGLGHAVAPLIDNPFNWTKPGWGPFGGVLKNKVGTFLGLFWLGCIIFCAFHFVHGVALVAGGSEDITGARTGVQAGRHKMMWSGGSAVLLGIVGTIFGVLIK